MKRLASDVLRELEVRVANLEKQEAEGKIIDKPAETGEHIAVSKAP